jgi:hypothetical protein
MINSVQIVPNVQVVQTVGIGSPRSREGHEGFTSRQGAKSPSLEGKDESSFE